MRVVLPVEMFNDTVIAFFGERKEFNDYVTAKFDIRTANELIEDCENSGGFTVDTNNGILIWLTDPEVETEILYHECLHATAYVMNRVGSPFNYDNQETIAYLQGFIAKRLLEKFKQKNKRGK